LPQAGTATPRQFLYHRSDRGIGISIAERPCSILQNNPEGKAFFFI